MIRLLHAADLHLDSPFSALTPEQAADRRRLQRQLPQLLCQLADRHGCRLLLLSGDVFDGERVCPETVEAMQRAFARCKARIFIAPGNHDPYHDRSPWVLAQWPENVFIFSREEPQTVTLPELGCRIRGGAFTSDRCRRGIGSAQAQTVPEIGVFHGELGSDGGYRPLTRREVEESGLTYLALGHSHSVRLPQKLGQTWVGWPGVTMGRGFDECGVHGVLLAEVEPGLVRAKLLPVDGPRYERITLEAGTPLQLMADPENVICRLQLTGERGLEDPKLLQQRLEGRFAALQVEDCTRPRQDLWEHCGDGTLRGLALSALKTQLDGGSADALLAAQYVLAALEGREMP